MSRLSPSSSSLQHALSPLLDPASVAVIGASADPGRVGGMPLHFLDATGYEGRIYPVNPRRDVVQGHRAVAGIRDVPEPVDLAIVAVPAAHVPQTLRECAAAGTRGAVVFSAGFAEVGEEGRARQEEIARIAGTSGMRVCGPNCAGIMNVAKRMTATFGSHLAGDQELIPGSISIVSQSGAVGAYMFSLARAKGIGLSYWVTTGNEADTQVADYVEAISQDPETRVIALYMEQFRDPERFMAACEVARENDTALVGVLAGKTEQAERALRSHTAAMAGDRAVAAAALEELGVTEVSSIDGLLSHAIGLSTARRPTGSGVGIVTISGGAGIMMVDRCVELGLSVPQLSAERQERMRTLLPYASTANPLDVTGNISNTPEVFGAFVEELLDADEIDAVICFLGHVVLSPYVGTRLVEELAALNQDGRAVISMVSMDTPDRRVAQCLSAADVPLFQDPRQAVDALRAAVRAGAIRADGADAVMARRAAMDDADAPVPPELGGRSASLSEVEAHALLRAAGVRFPDGRLVTEAAEAAQVAAQLGGELVMKIVSPDILHKTDIGGVRVDVAPENAAATFAELKSAAQTAAPDARLDGVLIQRRHSGWPVIVGTKLDAAFGPVVLVGTGGIDAELIADRALALAPLDARSAGELVSKTKLSPIIAGSRGRAPLDGPALVDLLVAVSRLAWQLRDQVASIELNPVLLEADGAVAVDALVELKGPSNGS